FSISLTFSSSLCISSSSSEVLVCSHSISWLLRALSWWLLSNSCAMPRMDTTGRLTSCELIRAISRSPAFCSCSRRMICFFFNNVVYVLYQPYHAHGYLVLADNIAPAKHGFILPAGAKQAILL